MFVRIIGRDQRRRQLHLLVVREKTRQAEVLRADLRDQEGLLRQVTDL